MASSSSSMIRDAAVDVVVVAIRFAATSARTDGGSHDTVKRLLRIIIMSVGVFTTVPTSIVSVHSTIRILMYKVSVIFWLCRLLLCNRIVRFKEEG